MKRLAAALLMLLAACAPAAPAHSPVSAEAREPHGVTTRDGAVGTYVSIPWGFSTSSY